jgi:hypothetical protein
MKNIYRSIATITLLSITVAFSQHTHDNHDHMNHGKMPQKTHSQNSDVKHHQTISPKMRIHINKVYSAYLSIADALTKDDFKKAHKVSGTLLDLAKSVKGNHAQTAVHKHMLKSIVDLKAAKNIEDLRNTFNIYSAMFIKHMHQHKELLNKDFKVYFCPMAKGKWVQDKTGTKNPYYGSKMLACGSEQK